MTVKTKMAARIAKVRPSNGTDQDNIRAGTERLIAALGGPAVVPIEPEQQIDATAANISPVNNN